MNKTSRKQMVLAMEKIMRCLNDESLFDSWMMCGVPDGDIHNYTIDEVDETLIEDENLEYLMGIFIRIMYKAIDLNDNGTLFIDGCISMEKSNG